MDYKTREQDQKTRKAPWLKPKAKHEISLSNLERTQKTRGEDLNRFGYDPESVKEFGGIVE